MSTYCRLLGLICICRLFGIVYVYQAALIALKNKMKRTVLLKLCSYTLFFLIFSSVRVWCLQICPARLSLKLIFYQGEFCDYIPFFRTLLLHSHACYTKPGGGLSILKFRGGGSSLFCSWSIRSILRGVLYAPQEDDSGKAFSGLYPIFS